MPENFINIEQQQIKQKVQEILEKAVLFCNRVLAQAELYKFDNMELPDPNVYQMSHILNVQIIPTLEKLADDPNLHPEDGIKVVNIQQYNLHLKNIVQALENEDEPAFYGAVQQLERESLLC